MITTAASKGRPEPTLVYIVKSAHLQRLRKHSGTIEEGKGKGNQSSAQQENRRLILKRISDERIRGWSDTVEAKREKKLRWKAERKALEEQERDRIDAEEAKLQEEERLEMLARAKALLFEQTDAMKTFRSAQRYSDILDTLNVQIKEMQEKVQMEKKEEEIYHKLVVDEMNKFDDKERKRKEKHQEYIKEITMYRKTMAEDAQASKRREEEVKQQEGRELLAQARREVEDDQQKALARKLRCRQDNEEMIKANINLQQHRKELAKAEAQEDEKIVADAAKKEAIVRERAQKQKARFEAKQKIRQQIIDQACAESAKQSCNEQAILNKRMQEQKDKEDAEAAQHQRLRSQMRAQIQEYRVKQEEAMQKRKEEQKQATKEQMAIWAKENAEFAEKEREAEERRWRRSIEIKEHQERQCQELYQRRKEEKASSFLVNHSTEEEEEKAHFLAYAKHEIEVAKQQGKNIYPLLHALHARPPIFAAKGNSRARRDGRAGDGEVLKKVKQKKKKTTTMPAEKPAGAEDLKQGPRKGRLTSMFPPVES